MELHSYLLRQSKVFTSEILISLPSSYTFHTIEHTRGVVRAVRVIGHASNLSLEQTDTVLIAAWFHDVGYYDGPKDHEDRSASIAAKMLTRWGASSKKVADVSRTILSTGLPQNPMDMLGMVLCDADLSHLASTRYEMHMLNLRNEQIAILGIREGDDQAWLLRNIEFLKSHHYFTDYGIEILEYRKRVNLNKMLRESQIVQI